MNLDELEKILGEPINRGRLASKFMPDNPTAISGTHVSHYLDHDASRREPRPPAGEDLSHLNPVHKSKKGKGVLKPRQ